MTVQRVENVTLPEVPDLKSRVITARQQVATVWVEVDLVYLGAVGIVVLDKPLAPNIPYLDRSVLAATGNAGAIWVESHRVDSVVVVNKRVDALSRGKVPQLHGVVIGAGSYQSLIRSERT